MSYSLLNYKGEQSSSQGSIHLIWLSWVILDFPIPKKTRILNPFKESKDFTVQHYMRQIDMTQRVIKLIINDLWIIYGSRQELWSYIINLFGLFHHPRNLESRSSPSVHHSFMCWFYYSVFRITPFTSSSYLISYRTIPFHRCRFSC